GWTLVVVLSIASALAMSWHFFRAADPSPVPTPPPAISGDQEPPQADQAPAATSGKPGTAPDQPPAPSTAPARANDVAPADALAEVRALVNKGSIGAARALAERYLQQIPDGPEADQIKSLTGVHPHP
ncbi:MAG: hypothetical protein ABW321_30035, partial [Polyangiales bacterium]